MISPRLRAVATSAAALTALFLQAASAQAAIVSASVSADVTADFDGAIDQDSSASVSQTLAAFSAANNSYTAATLDYAFDPFAGTFTANSLLVTEKTVSARRGGDHFGASNVTLQFQVDRDTNFLLDGTWGFLGSTASTPPDGLSFSLTGPSGTVASGVATDNSGTDAAAFSSSGLIGAGNYELTFNAQLAERMNNRGGAQAGWSINRFQLTEVTTVPEPRASLFLGMLLLMFVSQRRRVA